MFKLFRAFPQIKGRVALTEMVLCVMGEQHELFRALGWAFSGGRQLLPTLNVSLTAFLSHSGSVPHRGGEEVGQIHMVQDSP